MQAPALRQSFADALATADLRRLQAASGISATGGWTFFIALAVYAYNEHGTVGVGIAAAARMIPAGLAAPLAGVLADRHSRRDVLLVALVAKSLVLVSVAAAITADLPFGAVLVLATVFTVLMTAHRPAQAALLPSLAETPQQLAAANAIWSGTDNAAFLLGSLAGGALIATASIEATFMLTAALFAIAALPMAGIRRDPVPAHRRASVGALDELTAGLREVAGDDGLRLVVGFLTVSTLVEGAVDVLVVVVALELLGLADASVGWLNACWGVGGVIGGVVALGLMGRGRLAAGLAGGGLLVGASLLAIGAVATVGTAVVGLAVLGLGYALIEVAGLSLMQRLSSDEILARAFAVVESTYWAANGVGALCTPALVALLGVKGALLAVGALLPVAVAMRWAALARLEVGTPVPEEAFRVLRGVAIFGALPLAVVENVCRRLESTEVAAGEEVIREGDIGDRFYVIAEGSTDVTCAGEWVRTCGPGDVLGEIALLRDVPRTATVTARTDVVLWALERDAFLGAVGAYPRWSTAVDRSAGDRLATASAAPVGGGS